MDNLKAELEKRAQTYQRMLQDEGYGAKEPEWDAQTRTWDIRVKYEGVHVLIMLDLDDSDFVRIVLPNFYDLTQDQLQLALIAMEQTNKKCKGTKVYLNAAENDSIGTIEFLDDGSGISAKNLIRYLDMLVNAAKYFVKTFREQIDTRAPSLSIVTSLRGDPH